HLAPILKAWKAAPAVHVVQSEAELPPALRDGIAASRAQGHIEGLYDPKTDGVYLIGDNLRSPARAEQVLLHEALGHYGLRRFFGKTLDPFLDEVARLYGKQGLQPIAARYGFDLATKEGLRSAAEEKLAQLPETGEKPGLLKRFVGWVRQHLRNMGFRLRLSDADVHQVMRNAARGVRESSGATDTTESPRFSLRADDTIAHGADAEDELPELGKERVPVSPHIAEPPAGSRVLNAIKGNENPKDIENALHVLGAQRTLDEIDAMKYVQAAIKAGMTPADNRTFYDYLEQANLPKDQQTITLTPRQQALFNAYIKPFRDALEHGEGYVPREAVGKGGKLDRLAKSEGHGFGVGVLRKTLSSMKHRKFAALEEHGTGARHIISVKRQGGALKATLHENGRMTSLGNLRPTSTEAELARKLEPIDAEIKRLTAERKTLSATKARQAASPRRLKNIDRRLEDLRDARSQAEIEQEQLVGRVFRDKQGRLYHVKEATANEIERETPVRYYRNLLGKLADEYVGNRQVERQRQFLETLKEIPEFARIARPDGEAPDHWKTVHIPQFHGLKFEPYTAEVLNHFYRRSIGDFHLPVLSPLNNFLRKAMFSVLPVWHDFNIADAAMVQRGIRGITPPGIARLWRTLGPAMHEVMSLGPKYQRLMEQGAPFMYARAHLGQGMVEPGAFAEIVNSLGRELDEKPELHPIAQALGYVPGKAWDALKWWGHHAQTSLWAFNDVALMQGIMERERQGMSEEAAAKAVFDVMPNYRLPEGYKLLNALTNPNVSWFARYHLGLFKAYGKMMKNLLKNAEPGDRARAADQLAMVGLLGLAVYPVLDSVVQQATGNPKAHIARFGMSKIPSDLYEIAEGQQGLVNFLAEQLTPAPGSAELLQQGENVDFWTKEPIAPYYDTWPEAAYDRAKHVAENVNIPLSNYLEGQTPAQGLLRQFGVEVPPDRHAEYAAKVRADEIKRRREARYFEEHPQQ
ncbi:MAG: hypothetical protein KGL39_38735, partial [Patescibacteria group bacterium]|nr:hypothetical protein [Patescibacteria group bacterium]